MIRGNVVVVHYVVARQLQIFFPRYSQHLYESRRRTGRRVGKERSVGICVRSRTLAEDYEVMH